jgi:hypothetical protein
MCEKARPCRRSGRVRHDVMHDGEISFCLTPRGNKFVNLLGVDQEIGETLLCHLN